jgi:hypothetical protein
MNSAQDAVDGMMHYLTRLTLSAYNYDDDDDHQVIETADPLPAHLLPSKLTIFSISNKKSFIRFLQRVGPNLYHNISQDLNIVSDREKTYIHQLLTFEDEELREPYMAFVQCRSRRERTNLMYEMNQQNSWCDEFETLGEIYIHRRDVAFFVFVAHHPQECAWFLDSNDSTDDNWDGAIQIVRILPGLGENYEPITNFGAALYPSASSATDLSIKNFVVFHSTPSLLWYDRFTSAIWAFHLKRKIHVALFIDMHSPTFVDEVDLKSSLERTQVAMSALRKAALELKNNRPQDDIVFLIIPSTEIRIMRTFGIDVWSPMDKVMVGNINVTDALSESLPFLVVTSRNESSFYTKRFSLRPTDSMRCMTNYSDCDRHYTLEKFSSFLKDVLEGRAIHDIKSQVDPANQTNDSGVITLTGKSFKSLMGNLTTNTLIQFYVPWCGMFFL